MSEPVRILIVEDVASDFDLAQREIRRAINDPVFQQVQTKQDFLRALNDFQPDLILSDYQMPSFDGLTALKLAQEHAKLTPFIIWTGSMGEDIAVECMKAGAVNYILKDNLKRLGSSVAHALEERRLLLEHKRAAEIIQNNEKRFRALIENGLDNISLLAADGTLLWESPATVRTLGYEPDEFLGQNIFLLMHPDDFNWASERFEKLIQVPGSRDQGIFRLRHRDGTWRWTEAVVTNLLHEPSVQAIVINYRDITARKQAEEMLKEERNLLRTLIDHLPDRIYVMDAQGRKTLSNAADWKASGVEKMEDVLGKTDFDTYPLEMAKEFWALDKAVMDSGKPIINYEEPGFDAVGNLVWVLSTKVPLRDGQGNITGLVGIGRDITERKQSEIERQTLLEIMQGMADTDDLPHFLRLIHRSIARMIYAENFFVVLYNESTGLFEEIYSVDQYDEPASPSALEKSITSYVFRTGKPLLLTRPLFDQLVAQGEVELVGTDSVSWLGAPLKIQNRTIGVIVVQDYENPNSYTERDKDFLALIGSQIALAIERKQAEETLRRREQEFRSLAENIPDIVARFDRQLHHLYINDVIEKITGIPPQSFIGKNNVELEMPNAQVQLWDESLHHVFESGQSTTIEFEFPAVTGQRYFESLLVPELGQTGEVESVLSIARDITERKKAADHLNYHSRLLRHVNDAIIATDLQSCITAWNRAAEKMYGWSAKEVIGRNISEILNFKLTDEQRAEARGRLKESIASRSERMYTRRDGRILYVEANTIALSDEHGKFTGYVSVHRDSTERKRAEEALVASQRRFQSLIEHAPDGIALLGSDGKLRQVTPSTEQILGYTLDESIGQDPALLTHPDDLPALLSLLSDLIQNPDKVQRGEYRFRHKNGSWRWLESTISNLIAEPSVEAIVFNYRDITQRKQSEEALRESETRYRLATRATNDVIWEWTSKTKQLTWSENAQHVLGYSPEEINDETWWDNHIHPEDYQRVISKMDEVLGGAETIWSSEYRFLLKNGSYANISDHGYIERDTNGDAIRMIGAMSNITERKRAEEQTQLQIQRLRALRAIDVAISSSSNLSLTLDFLLNQVVAQLKTDAAAVLLFQPITRTLVYTASRGFRSVAIREGKVRLGEGFAGQAVLERRPIHISNLMATDTLSAQAILLKDEEFKDYYCVPLIIKGEVKGALEIFHRSTLESDPEWLDFLETLAGQAVIAIENSTLFENLQRSNQELFQAYDATIEGWSHALDLRDKETEGHTQRVTELTMELARKFGFSEEQLINIRWGALLHDIGKMGVPDSILLKPDKLTEAEWEIMRRHPTFAFEMLSPIGFLKSSLDIPYCHHEKWDGSGYPRGLKGEVIPLAARLFAVVDVWDALRSDRPYRKGWTVEQTIEHIRNQSGSHFDPKVVEQFLGIIGWSNG